VITSHSNSRLQLVRRLQRARDRRDLGLFVAEGEDLLAAADAAGWAPEERLAAAGSGLPGEEVEPELLARASSLGSGTRTLGIFRQRWAEAPAGPRCVALWGVRDPGNVGAVLRSGLAFGVSCVALGPDTADPWSPKAVRASMGAVFAVPLARSSHPSTLPPPRIALVARAGTPLRGPAEPFTLVVGAEREGLPGEVVEACEQTAHIPIASESLNAAMATTIALYELTR
jgi:RNA methyltransferase, TrmH family